MSSSHLSRRLFMSAAPVAAITPMAAKAQDSQDYTFEITRTLPEWLQLLNEEEFRIMRLQGTEKPKSSETWDETRPGHYACKGCDLTVYYSEWKTVLNKGWAFFRHAAPNALLMGIDGAAAIPMADAMGASTKKAKIEVHCRRCGSHMGHVLWVEKEVLHCINGQALNFVPRTA